VRNTVCKGIDAWGLSLEDQIAEQEKRIAEQEKIADEYTKLYFKVRDKTGEFLKGCADLNSKEAQLAKAEELAALDKAGMAKLKARDMRDALKGMKGGAVLAVPRFRELLSALLWIMRSINCRIT
jgi:hypothetical protein